MSLTDWERNVLANLFAEVSILSQHHLNLTACVLANDQKQRSKYQEEYDRTAALVDASLKRLREGEGPQVNKLWVMMFSTEEPYSRPCRAFVSHDAAEIAFQSTRSLLKALESVEYHEFEDSWVASACEVLTRVTGKKIILGQADFEDWKVWLEEVTLAA